MIEIHWFYHEINESENKIDSIVDHLILEIVNNQRDADDQWTWKPTDN